jgi:hypothetical protein
MPIRFRRTFKILPGVKVNMSKGGISVTVGPRGFHLNFGKHGVRQTVGIPGSGLSETSYLIKNKPDSEQEKEKESGGESHKEKQDANEDDRGIGCSAGSCLLFILVLAVVGYFAANTFGLIPPNYLSHLLEQFTIWLQGAGL